MLLLKRDYKFCVRMSIQILQEQRQKLTEDSINLQAGIGLGLHMSDENQSFVQDLYFQQYCVSWMNQHWERMHIILDRYGKYTLEQRRDITIFFAEYFKAIFVDYGQVTPFLIPNLLEIKKEAIDNLLKYTDKWEQNSNGLRRDLLKHKEQYQKMIREYFK